MQQIFKHSLIKNGNNFLYLENLFGILKTRKNVKIFQRKYLSKCLKLFFH